MPSQFCMPLMLKTSALAVLTDNTSAVQTTDEDPMTAPSNCDARLEGCAVKPKAVGLLSAPPPKTAKFTFGEGEDAGSR